jgi:hypothetical protein
MAFDLVPATGNNINQKALSLNYGFTNGKA